ncbi:MAG: hypothetical protein KGN34_09975 [Sphingomonadales bacterium]|nr:hypothetical protein [Sphingomonadales bacterium]
MSRSRRRALELERIGTLRSLSTQVALHGAFDARRALGEADAEHRREEAALDQRLDDWRLALATPGFDPAAIVGWGRAVNHQVERIGTCAAAVEQRRGELDTAQAAWTRAQAEQDCAEMLLRRASSRVEREREEARLAERDDETTRKAVRS